MPFVNQYRNLSDAPIPPGTTPSVGKSVTAGYWNNYGGGKASVIIEFNNQAIIDRYTTDDEFWFRVSLNSACSGCAEDCIFYYSCSTSSCGCSTEDEEFEGVIDWDGALKCSSCTGFICITKLTDTRYQVTSKHEGYTMSFDSSLVVGQDYTITVGEEVVPIGLETIIPVGYAVVNNPVSEFYHHETAHLPLGDPQNERFLGITVAGETSLSRYGEVNNCCDCPGYAPCQPICVIESGVIVVTTFNTPSSLGDEVLFISDPNDPNNGQIGFNPGVPPTTQVTVAIPNAKVIEILGTNYVKLELK